MTLAIHTLVLVDLEDRSVAFCGSGLTFEAALESLNDDLRSAHDELAAEDSELELEPFKPLEVTPENNWSCHIIYGASMVLQHLTVEVAGIRREKGHG